MDNIIDMNEILNEIKYQLQSLHYEVIDLDDFANAIEEIYWEFKVNSKPNLKSKSNAPK